MSNSRGIKVTPDRIVVFPGGKPSIGFTQQIYGNAGDEVIYPSPGFPIYESFIRYLNMVPKPLHLAEEAGFTFTAKDLEKLITPKTKIIILNFPSNPTGGVATPEQLKEIAEVIMKKCNPNVRVYSDEIYENILFDGAKQFSIAQVPGMEKRTIISSGFSKGFAWTGGRIGYICTPTAEEAQMFKAMNINYFSCVPGFTQEAAAYAMKHPDLPEWQAKLAKVFESRRDITLEKLNAIEGVKCQRPGGAFYLFPNIAGICKNLGILDAYKNLDPKIQVKTSPSTLFQSFLLYNYGLAVIDRRSFGSIGTEKLHFLRLSIASEQSELDKGVECIEKASKDKEGFRKFLKTGPLFL